MTRRSIRCTVSAEIYAIVDGYAKATRQDVSTMAGFLIGAGIGAFEALMKQDGETPAELLNAATALEDTGQHVRPGDRETRRPPPAGPDHD
jgi:hypothetical protein